MVIKQKVIFTVDVEGPRGSDPIKYQIWGETNSGEKFGIPKLMDKLDERGVKGLFFVDFAEAIDYGEDKISEVAKYIIDRGHDVGVHLHPHHMNNSGKHFLWQYSKNEQYEMIKKCTELYENATGTKPLSFRAGKYGANYDTLDILSELGYKYDFSMFYRQKWCGISPVLNRALPRKYKNIIEFPVTIFRSFKLFNIYERYDKLDFNINPSELRHILNAYSLKKKEMVITLFAHSFSLLDYLDRPNDPLPISRNVKRLESALQFIQQSNTLEFISEKELENVWVSQDEDSDADIANNKVIGSFGYLFLRALSISKHNNLAKILVFSYLLLAIAIFSLIIMFLR